MSETGLKNPYPCQDTRKDGPQKDHESRKTTSPDDLPAMRARGEIKAPPGNAPLTDMPPGFWDTADPRMPDAKPGRPAGRRAFTRAHLRRF